MATEASRKPSTVSWHRLLRGPGGWSPSEFWNVVSSANKGWFAEMGLECVQALPVCPLSHLEMANK